MKLQKVSAALATVPNILPRSTTNTQGNNSQKPPAPVPYSFPASQNFDGNDGAWSTFIVRVGTPEQSFRVLPSTNGQEIWVPVIGACVENYTESCGDVRGVNGFQQQPHGGFEANRSMSWVEEGIFDLSTDANLGYQGRGLYGFDTLALAAQGAGGPVLENQTVAGFQTDDFYLGYFGLGPKPVNFSDFNDPIPSAMTTLANKNIIPSSSYGFTAGASYNGRGAPGSLTLGGYDASRFTPNNVTFHYNQDDSKSLTVALQKIRASNTMRGNLNALSLGVFALVESTATQIWLPGSVCDTFADAFGLTYDNDTGFYLVNDTMHNRLQELQPTLTFTLGDSLTDQNRVEITLPYAALDLQVKYPYYLNPRHYFPIRRGANETQYTLGRTFLQEAYVVANNEEQTFQVAQAVYDESAQSRIIPITKNMSDAGFQSSTSDHSQSISSGVIIGLSVVLVVVCVSIVGITIFLLRRRRTRRASEQSARDDMSSSSTVLGPASPGSYRGGLGESPTDYDPKQKFGSTSKTEESHPGWFKTELPSDASAYPHKSLVWEDGELVKRPKPMQDGEERKGVQAKAAQELMGCGPAREMEDSQMQYANTPSSGSTAVPPWQEKFEPKEEIIYEMVGDTPITPPPPAASPAESENQGPHQPPAGFI